MSCCKKLADKISHGVVGLSQAAAVATAKAVGVEMEIATPPEQLAIRRNHCRACPDRTRSEAKKFIGKQGLTTWSMCLICHCNIAAKTSLASESCPKGLW